MKKLEQAARPSLKADAAMRLALEALEMHAHGAGSVIHSKLAWDALREALAEQAEQDLDTCPGCGGVADNGHDREFPPNPYYCTKCSEQAEQEPVGWWNGKETVWFGHELITDGPIGEFQIPLYTAPVRTKDPCNPLQDLTDDEIDALVDDACDSQMPMDMFARAVIAADKEKNKC